MFFRQAFGQKGIDIVAINDLGDIDNLAYLLKYDSVYRTYERQVASNTKEGLLVVDGKKIKILQEKNPAKLPWKDLKVDVAVESTGAFESFEAASAHLRAGAKRVVITAPARDDERPDAKTVLLGVNEEEFKRCKITSNGSCTTNAAHPVVAVLAENPGIKKAILATVHGYTATQNLVDGPTRGKDFRRGRAAAVNISPSFTGAVTSVNRAVKALNGKFDGLAYRVPIVAGSLADITFVAKRSTTAGEINDILTKAADSKRWKGILAVTKDPLVSSDIIGAPYASLVDLQYTKVIDGDLVKVLSWYDNEFGYAVTLVRHVLKVAESI